MPYVENDGVKIWFELEGDGPPLLLMHGTGATLGIWRLLGVVEALKSDYKLILVDARGHGQSDKPHDPADYLPEPKSKDIEAILDHLGIEATHYMGYSMGGRIGFDVVAHAPHRLLSLIAGGAGPSPLPMYEASQQLFQSGDTIEEVLATRESVSGELPEPLRSEFLANDIDALHASLDRSILDQEELYKSTLMKFDKPTFMFAGTADSRYEDVADTAEKMPNAEFVAIDKADHLGGFWQVGEIIPRIKSFLASV